MNTEFWTDHDVDGLVERLTTHLDEHAARAGTPARSGGPDRDEAGALTEELRSVAAWAGPPPSLRDAILARARAGTAVAAAPPAPAPAATPEPLVSPEPTPAPPDAPETAPAGPGWRTQWLAGWRSRWRRLAWAIPATAMAAAVFTVAVLTVDRALQPGQPPAEVYAIVGSQLAPQARGEVRVSDTPSGFSIELNTQQLPAAAPGSYYAAWLRGPEGVVPLGSFHMRGTGTPVRLWSGVPPNRYPELVVTLQAEGDPLVPSQLVVITASLAG